MNHADLSTAVSDDAINHFSTTSRESLATFVFRMHIKTESALLSRGLKFMSTDIISSALLVGWLGKLQNTRKDFCPPEHGNFNKIFT